MSRKHRSFWDEFIHDAVLTALVAQDKAQPVIAQEMGFSHRTVERHLMRLGLTARTIPAECYEAKKGKARASDFQVREARKEMPAVIPVPYGFAREGRGAHPYAVAVLKLAGEMPEVSMMPLPIIRLANEVLKRMNLPQIADRADWVV